jgi:(p)ppGpp synthase/HD superfamily hydrolase
MGQRLADTAAAAGIGPEGRSRIARSYGLAMEPRRAALIDDHDPSYLHPGRCAVILMDDLACAEPRLLCAAVFVETEAKTLAVPASRISKEVGEDVATLVEAVPQARAPDLAECLLLADPAVRVLSLVERLDQLRHAHLWTDMERRRIAYQSAVEVYLPVAIRTDPTLARRYRWWCSMFARRHLQA